jgi:hypothetical protein
MSSTPSTSSITTRLDLLSVPTNRFTIMSDTERMVHELGTLLDVLLQADDNARKR